MIIRKRFFGISASYLALIFIIFTQSAAATTPASPITAADDKDKLIQAITKRTELLENEVRTLKHELKLVQANRTTATQVASDITSTELFSTKTKVTANQVEMVSKNKMKSAHLKQRSVSDSRSVGEIRHSLPPSPGLEEITIGRMPALLFLGGTPVVTAPYIGVRSQFDASDLIVNIPSVNEDLRLLTQWQHLEEEYANYNVSVPNRPFIDLSGKVEAQAISLNPYTGRMQSDIDVSEAEFDISARVTSWAGAYVAMTYDNSQTTPQRTANSRVYVKKAFITAGDLDTFPGYITIGQAYPPFGLYSTSMISAPLTQLLARTRARYLQLGFAHTDGLGPYGAVYAFRGNTATVSPSNRINQAGINLGYKYKNDSGVKASIGAGMIANIADSDGMQGNGASAGFSGFGATTATEVLLHQVPAADIHAELAFGSFSVLGEYIAATRSFNAANMMFNGHGARPQALHAEGSYSFHAFPLPLSLTVGYQQSMQALALLIPQRRYIAAFNTSMWRSTIQTLEYRHDINYATPTIASGQNVPVVSFGAQGETSNQITAQFGVYF